MYSLVFTKIEPTDILRGYVLQAWQYWGMSVPEHNDLENGRSTLDIRGLPDPEPFASGENITLVEELQLCLFWTFRSNAPAEQPDEDFYPGWLSFVDGHRCYTNRLGPNNGYWDMITKTNEGGPLMKWVGPVITGGNTTQLVNDKKSRIYQREYHEFHAIQASMLVAQMRAITRDDEESMATWRKRQQAWFLSTYNPKKTPYLIQKATNSTRDVLPDGSRRQEEFPQRGGKDVLTLVLSNYATDYLIADRIRVLAPNEPTPSPYNP